MHQQHSLERDVVQRDLALGHHLVECLRQHVLQQRLPVDVRVLDQPVLEGVQVTRYMRLREYLLQEVHVRVAHHRVCEPQHDFQRVQPLAQVVRVGVDAHLHCVCRHPQVTLLVYVVRPDFFHVFFELSQKQLHDVLVGVLDDQLLEGLDQEFGGVRTLGKQGVGAIFTLNGVDESVEDGLGLVAHGCVLPDILCAAQNDFFAHDLTVGLRHESHHRLNKLVHQPHFCIRTEQDILQAVDAPAILRPLLLDLVFFHLL